MEEIYLFRLEDMSTIEYKYDDLVGHNVISDISFDTLTGLSKVVAKSISLSTERHDSECVGFYLKETLRFDIEDKLQSTIDWFYNVSGNVSLVLIVCDKNNCWRVFGINDGLILSDYNITDGLLEFTGTTRKDPFIFLNNNSDEIKLILNNMTLEELK